MTFVKEDLLVYDRLNIFRCRYTELLATPAARTTYDERRHGSGQCGGSGLVHDVRQSCDRDEYVRYYSGLVWHHGPHTHSGYWRYVLSSRPPTGEDLTP